MRKIKLFPTSEQFNSWAIYESDLSQEAKAIYTMYQLNPSRILPTYEETRKYTSIKTMSKIRAAIKELEIRGVIVFPEGNGKELIIRDAVKPKPEVPIMEIPSEEKPALNNNDVEQVRIFYMSEYMRRTGERYPWQWGKDNKAAQNLARNYGVDGAKAKIQAAFESSDGFFRKQALSIFGVVTIASKLIQQQIQEITQSGKWEVHTKNEIKINGGEK